MTGTDALESAAKESGYGPSSVLRGWPGHPLHPAFAHVAMGGYTVGAVLAVLGRAGVSEHDLAKGWWLAVLVGFAASGGGDADRAGRLPCPGTPRFAAPREHHPHRSDHAEHAGVPCNLAVRPRRLHEGVGPDLALRADCGGLCPGDGRRRRRRPPGLCPGGAGRSTAPGCTRLNRKEYDHMRIDQEVEAGTVGEWTMVNGYG